MHFKRILEMKTNTFRRELCKLNGFNELLFDGRGRSNTFKDILLAADSDFSRLNRTY